MYVFDQSQRTRKISTMSEDAQSIAGSVLEKYHQKEQVEGNLKLFEPKM